MARAKDASTDMARLRAPGRHGMNRVDTVRHTSFPFEIRPIDAERDGALLIAYAKELFAISFADPRRFVDQFGMDGSGYLPWIAEKQASDPGSAALLLLGGEPAGMVVIGPWPGDPTIGYVFHYYLEPHARSLGLGSELDAYAVSALRQQEHRQARLSVAETNARARHFYRSRGWTDAGPRPDQPGILYMQKSLDD